MPFPRQAVLQALPKAVILPGGRAQLECQTEHSLLLLVLLTFLCLSG